MQSLLLSQEIWLEKKSKSLDSVTANAATAKQQEQSKKGVFFWQSFSVGVHQQSEFCNFIHLIQTIGVALLVMVVVEILAVAVLV